MRGKKMLAFVVALSAAVMSFAGCAGKAASSSESSGESKAETSATESESKPVTVEFWTISLQPTFTDFFNKLIDEYQKENTNVKVKWVDLPYDSIQQKLITASASDTSPDVVNLNTQMALSLAGKGALVDLNKEATEAQKSIYIDTLYNSAKIGDSVYAFPWYASPSVMIYNKELFEKSGFAATPKTFEEAALVDGANKFISFVKIKIPLLKPYIWFCSLNSVISAVGVFDVVFVLTSGGPDNATMVINYYSYFKAFNDYESKI